MKALFALTLFALLSGCVAEPYRPIVDNGQPRGNYEDDLNDCKGIASQVQPVNSAAGGAVVGGVFAGLLAAAVGLRGNDVGRVAAWGAANGAIHGAVYGSAEWKAIVDRCMAGRGYNVLN
jgi:hypothetical protein